MWSSRLFWKTFGVYSVLTLLAVGAFTTVVANRLRESAVAAARQRLVDLAIVLQPVVRAGLESVPTDEWRRRLERIATEHGVHLSVLALDGTIVGDTRGDPRVLANDSDRPEVREALVDGLGVAERPNEVGEEFLYVAHRTSPSADSAGVLRIGVPLERVRGEIAAIQRPVWITAAALVLLGFVSTYAILRRIVVPLRRLTDAARAMTEGDVAQRVEVRSRDELGTLAAAFNAMGAELARRIEQLRRKTEALEEGSERLETVLGAMIEGVLAIDADERILFANRAARRMLGRESGELVGRPIWEAVWNARVQEVVRRALVEPRSSWQSALVPGPPEIVEQELGGRRLAFSASRLPGVPCPGLVLVLHDVTDLRRLENLRTEFVQNVSHELKTPLALIQVNTETLLDWALEDPVQTREMLGNVVEQCERLNNLIRDLLALARIESDREALVELRPVPLDEVVERCVEEFETVAGARGVVLATEPPPRAVLVRADEDGLRTILKNLVENAVTYTPEGGRVLVRWRTRPLAGTAPTTGTETDVTFEPHEVAVLEVEDTGIGIHPDDQPRIFERFFRVDKARSRDAGGTGLGLSIVKHLAQQFGGRVSVRSRVGRGSTFVVELPVAAAVLVER